MKREGTTVPLMHPKAAYLALNGYKPVQAD